MTKIPGFESLSKKEYERNAGRIADVDNLNHAHQCDHEEDSRQKN